MVGEGKRLPVSFFLQFGFENIEVRNKTFEPQVLLKVVPHCARTRWRLQKVLGHFAAVPNFLARVVEAQSLKMNTVVAAPAKGKPGPKATWIIQNNY